MERLNSMIEFAGLTMRPVQTSNFDALVTIWADTEVTRFLPSRAIQLQKKEQT
ncbi:MAG: hypothetical protein PUP93_34545 [Rhizonema sp. NSF051]|nr:hypothetical protein [Rhizonema sp. NSF051]